MNGKDLIERLSHDLNIDSSRLLAERLGITPGRVSQLRSRQQLTVREVSNMIVRNCTETVQGGRLIERLKKDLSRPRDTDIAELLGVTTARISQLRNQKSLSARELANMIKRSRETARVGAISPVVERYPIDKNPSRHAAGYELFVAAKHPYKTGLKNELGKHHGVYIFYDSVGCALYVGKASKQKLWPEMKSAFNRSRTKQAVMRVQHPKTKHLFRTSDEKVRQICCRGSGRGPLPPEAPRPGSELGAARNWSGGHALRHDRGQTKRKKTRLICSKATGSSTGAV